MSGNLFGIGVTGLQAAQYGLTTTSHNITNVNTAGYNRQEVVQGTNLAQGTGAGFLGTGTAVETVRRLFNDLLSRQVLGGESQSASLQTYNAQISQINNLLADPAAGLSPALQDFFNGVQNVANDPSSGPARQVLLGAAQGLMARFHLLDQRVGELGAGINRQIAAQVSEINSFAQQVAQLNERIALAEGSVHQPANDLRDQRDQLVLEINRRIGASAVAQGDAYNVFIGNGVPIVAGSNAFPITVLSSPTDPSRLLVGVATGGTTVQIQETSLQGGTLGGLLAFRSQVLEPVQNAIGRIAIVFASAVNDQHALGQDLSGAPGGSFFTVPPPLITSSTSNTGTATLAAAFATPGALTTSDYLVGYDGVNYNVIRLSDNVLQTFAALPATVDGVTLTLAAGAPNAGDQFLLRPTANGASGVALAINDPARIAAAAPMRTGRAAANTGAASISAGSVNAPPPQNANLQQSVTITFTSATTYDVAGIGAGLPATGVAYTSGANISYNGWTAQISGVPAAGDVFTVSANLNGVSDNRNALLLGALQAQALVAGGTATLQSAYGQLVSQVGSDTRQSQIQTEAQTAFLEQARQAQQSFGGVNLDEEAANLVRYQQAYQASARVIQTGSRLFDDLMSIFSQR